MTRYHVNNREVPHLWAHQTQQYAEGNGSISFRGRDLYSYAARIATLHVDKTGAVVAALHIDRTWSNTTSKHQSYARSATSHLPSFCVPDLDGRHAENFENYRKNFEAALVRYGAAKARKGWHLGTAECTLKEANEYAERFGLRSRLKMPVDVATYAAGAAKREKDRTARARAKAKAEDLVAFKEWQEGLRAYCPVAYQDVLRLRVLEGRVESSKGAQCPVAHARLAFLKMRKCKLAGMEWKPNGEQLELGTFKVDGIEADGTLRAGCHTVTYSEGLRLAGLLGWE